MIEESKNDLWTIRFIDEYYRNNGEFEKLNIYINNIPRKYLKHPEITFLKVRAKKFLGKIPEFINDLSAFSSNAKIMQQEVMENVLSELCENNMFDSAEILLQGNNGKWDLSPKIILAKANILLDSKEYSEAKRGIVFFDR